MNKICSLFTAIILLVSTIVSAQYSYGDKWYNNPLGFNPIALQSRNGFIVPAATVGIALLLTKKDTTLAKKLSIYSEDGLSWGYKYPYTNLFQKNTGIVFKLRKWISVGVELDFYFPYDAYNNTFGIAVRPFARFYPVSNKKMRFYFESGGGLIYFMANFPKPTNYDSRLGSFWNGTTKYGIGGEVTIDFNTSVMFGIRHVHVSNGDTYGADRNPSHDSNGIFIGFTRKLGRD